MTTATTVKSSNKCIICSNVCSKSILVSQTVGRSYAETDCLTVLFTVVLSADGGAF